MEIILDWLQAIGGSFLLDYNGVSILFSLQSDRSFCLINQKLLRACNLSSGFQFNTDTCRYKEVRQAQHDTVAVNQQGLP